MISIIQENKNNLLSSRNFNSIQSPAVDITFIDKNLKEIIEIDNLPNKCGIQFNIEVNNFR